MLWCAPTTHHFWINFDFWVIFGNVWSKSSKLTVSSLNIVFDTFWPKVAKVDFVSKINTSQFRHMILAKDAVTQWHSPVIIILVEIDQNSRQLTFGSKMHFKMLFSAIFDQLVIYWPKVTEMWIFGPKISRRDFSPNLTQKMMAGDCHFVASSLAKIICRIWDVLIMVTKSIFASFGQKLPKMMFDLKPPVYDFWT